ncbi:hypothetical protein ACFL6G_09300 [candidate division KSB1 bacterium]
MFYITNKRDNKVIIFSIVLFVSIIISGVSSAQQGIPVLNREFPVFTLPALDGGEINLTDYQGKRNILLVTLRGWVGYW